MKNLKHNRNIRADYVKKKKKIPRINGQAFHLPVLALRAGLCLWSTEPSPVYCCSFVSSFEKLNK